MALVSQKITDFPRQSDSHPPLAPIPAHLVSEERDPAREIRNLIEQLQETTLEARKLQRKAEEECDQMRRRLLEIENRGAPQRGEDSLVNALTRERDLLLQQQNQYGPVIADLKQRLRAAESERAEAIRQRDLARKGGGSAKGGDAEGERQITALRQARDGMAAQLSEMKRKVGKLEDQAAEMSFKRDALENELNASQARVRELQARLDAGTAPSADAKRLAGLESELHDLRGKLDEAERQIESFGLERDCAERQLAESTNSFETQLRAQGEEIARLKADLSDAVSRLSENEQLTRQFDRRRLDMIELATQLENAQREIRNLSASLAEARLQAKLSGKKSPPAARPEASCAGTDIAAKSTPPDADDIAALSRAFEKFSRDQTQTGLLTEMENRALCVAGGAKDSDCPVLSRIAVAFANFLRDLHEIPEQNSHTAHRTAMQTIELLALLRSEPAIGEALNLSEARIYVVDDDAATCAMVVEAMDVVGLQTNFALYSREAVAQLAETRYDLIILDVHLPEMDGFELCSEIRGMSLHAETPVFFVTGDTSLENRVKSSLRGGNEFLAKPFSFHELGLKAIRAVITSRIQCL